MSTVAAVVVVVAVVIIFAFVVRRRGRRRRPLRPLYVTALEQLLAGEREEGYRTLKEEVSANPSNTRAYLLLGDLLRERGQPERAARLHQQLLVRPGLGRETKSEIRIRLARDLEAAGNWQAAEKVYREVVRQAEGERVGAEGLARTLENRGKWEAALEVRRRLKDTDPSVEALILTKMGHEQLEKGRHKEARARFTAALRKHAGCSLARLLVGDSYLREGKLDEAVSQWKAVVEQDQALVPEAFGRLEEALFQGGRFGEMERIYHEALERRPDDGGTVEALAGFLARKDEKAEAIEVCQAYLEKHPDDRRVRLKLALLRKDVGDAQEALAHVLELLPGEDTALCYVCANCGHRADHLMWLCPSCGQWALFRRSH